MRISKLFTTGVVFSFMMATSAFAHTQWISASATQVQVSSDPARPAYVTFDAAASAGVFDPDHVALKLDNIVITAPDGSVVDPENKMVGKLRSVFDAKLEKAGTYRIAVVGDGVFATFKQGTEMKRIRGTSEDEVKKALPADATDVQISKVFSRVETMVIAGKPGDIKPIGKGLELFPLQPVSDLVVGEKAKFLLLKDGAPLGDTDVKIIPGGVRYRGQLGDKIVKSNAKGEVVIDWAFAGKYYLNASFPPRPAGAEGDKPQGKPPEGKPAMDGGAPKEGAKDGVKDGQGPRPMMPMQPLRYNYGLTVEVLPE